MRPILGSCLLRTNLRPPATLAPPTTHKSTFLCNHLHWSSLRRKARRGSSHPPSFNYCHPTQANFRETSELWRTSMVLIRVENKDRKIDRCLKIETSTWRTNVIKRMKERLFYYIRRNLEQLNYHGTFGIGLRRREIQLSSLIKS